MHTQLTDRPLFSLSWPIFIDLFLHFATLIINTYMVSTISSTLVAAMGVGNHVFDLSITIFSFISVGCSIVIAQYLGIRNQQMARQVIHISIALNALLGISCALIIIFFGRYALIAMNMPENLLDDSFAYLHILGICLIPEAISLILAACLRVYGKTRTAMYVTLLVNLITIFGNYLVLYGSFGLPQLGLVGVAWSTVFARVVGMILLLILLSNSIHMRFQPRQFFIWSQDLVRKILKIGLPAAGENLSWMLQYTIALSFVLQIGTQASAAQTIYFQIALFVMLFGIAISIGNEIIVGHLVGAKRFDDAYRHTFKSLGLGMIVTCVVVISFWLLRTPIMTFLSHDPEVIAMSLPLFTLCVFLEPGRTINIVMVNALRASGDARFPLITAIIFMWGVALPISWFCGLYLGWGLVGIWFGFLCDEWIRGIVNGWRWYSRRWQHKRLNID